MCFKRSNSLRVGSNEAMRTLKMTTALHAPAINMLSKRGKFEKKKNVINDRRVTIIDSIMSCEFF